MKKIILNDKYKILGSEKPRYWVITGGRGSGKSFAVNVFLSSLIELEPKHKVLFTRYTMTSAEKSIIPEFVEKLDIANATQNYEISKKNIRCKTTGSEIMFSGIKTSSGNQTANLKSLAGITTFVLDEAEELVDEKIFDDIDLSVRLQGIQNRVIIIMNPATREHWIYKRFFEQSGVKEGFNGIKGNTAYIHTTYLDNINNLQESFLQRVEQIKKTNPKKYEHQIMGGWLAKAEGVIFENWETGEFKDNGNTIFGQDYGFSIDPTTLVEVSVFKNKKEIYLKEHLRKTGLSANDIFRVNKEIAGKSLIIGDSAEPRLISELRRLGNNIESAEKGQGSITAGISQLQDFKIIIDPNSTGLIKEFNNYVWSDKKSSVPVDDYNHCFVGDTLIETNKGCKQIKDIEIGDRVLTSKGYKQILKKFNNGRKKTYIFRMLFDTFSLLLECTDSHLIKTSRGWKPIREIQTKDKIYLSNTLMEKVTSYIKTQDIFQEDATGCTLLCGNIIMERYLKDTTYITKTKTLTTIESKTSNAYLKESILYCTEKKELRLINFGIKNSEEKELSQLKNGTHQKRELNGIKNMQKGLVSEIENTEVENAMYVKKSTKQKQLIKDFAPTNVSPNSEELTDWTMKIENVRDVEVNLQQTNTQKQNFVQEAVVQEINKTHSGCQDVYDIMVEGEHEYIANGILVHNSIDAVRYAVRKYLKPSAFVV